VVQYDAMCWSMLHCVAAHCSTLQCIEMCCSALERMRQLQRGRCDRSKFSKVGSMGLVYSNYISKHTLEIFYLPPAERDLAFLVLVVSGVAERDVRATKARPQRGVQDMCTPT